MKKFNWKAVLIAVLAFVLVFALVACNKDDNKTDDDKKPAAPGSIATSDYFNELWDLTKGIGDETIASGKDVYLSADLGLKLGTRDGNRGNEKAFELGIKAEVKLDRTSTAPNEGKNTAVKLGLYSGSKHILDLYYALATPNNFYIDFNGAKILLAAPTTVTLSDESTYTNASLGSLLIKGINQPFSATNAQTFNTVLNTLTGSMGADWDLDSLINGILPVFGLDTNGLIEMVKGLNLGLEDMILKTNPDNTQSISVKQAFANKGFANFFTCTKTGEHYVATAGRTITSAVQGMIAQANGGDRVTLELSFDKENGALKDGVTISLDDVNASYRKGALLNNGSSHPFVSVQIKDLEFGDGTHTVVAPTASEYSKDAQLEIKETLDLKGVTLNNEKFDGKQLVLFASARLDLETENLAENKTQANVYLQYGTKKLIEASFVKGNLSVTIDRTADTIGDYEVLDMLVSGFGDQAYNFIKTTFFKGDEAGLTKFADAFFEGGAAGDHKAIKDSFQGARWTNISPKDIYQMAVDAIVANIEKSGKEKQPSAPATSSAEEPWKFDSKVILGTVCTAFDTAIKDLSEGKITLASADALQTVCDIANKFLNNGKNDQWTKDSCIDEAEKMVIDIVAGFKTKDFGKLPEAEKEPLRTQAKTLIEATLEEVFKTTDQNEDYAHLKIDGFDIANRGANETYLHYTLKAVLNSLNANIVLDFTNGLGWTVEAKFAGVELKYTSAITINKQPAAQTDLGANKTEADGWVIFDMSEAA